MKVLCINAGIIQGSSNKSLHLIKEGQTYTVYEIDEVHGYDIGIDVAPYNKTRWNPSRFLPLSEINELTIKSKSNY